MAPFQVSFLGLVGDDDVVGGLHPSEACRDRRDGTLGALGPLVAVQVQTVWTTARRIENLVVTGVEGVLERAGNIAGLAGVPSR